MVFRFMRVVLLCFMAIGVAAGHAIAKDSSKSEYAFKPGELIRYRIAASCSIEATISNGSPVTTQPVKLTGVIRQRAKRILSDGNAEVMLAMESLSVTHAGQTWKVPVEQVPPATMIISKDGTLKSEEGLQGIKELLGSQVGNDLLPAYLIDLGIYNRLPSAAVETGGVWSQVIKLPGGSGELKAENRLSATKSNVDKEQVAVFEQETVLAPNAALKNIKMEISGNATLVFSSEKGRMARVSGRSVLLATGTGPNGQPFASTMRIEYLEEVLPPQKGK